MVRSLGPSVRERAMEGGKQEGKGRETDGRTDGVISFAPNVHVAAAVAGGGAGMAGHINKWISNGRGQLTLGEGNTFIIIQQQIGDVRVTQQTRAGSDTGEAAIVRATSFTEIFLLLILPGIRIHVGKCRGRA